MLGNKNIIVYHDVKGMTESQYDKITADLEKAGALNNPARMYHVSYKTPDGLKVVEMWADPESFSVAGQTVVPIIIAGGVTPPQPVVVPVHAIWKPLLQNKHLEMAGKPYFAPFLGTHSSIFLFTVPTYVAIQQHLPKKIHCRRYCGR